MGNDLKSFLGRGFLCLLVVFGVLGLTETVFSLDYPTKTITVVAGGDPGSGMDVVTRAIVEEAKKILITPRAFYFEVQKEKEQISI